MSSASNSPNPWTPEAIATIVYRVVMIVVSIAFIWKKYRRPVRSLDEEQGLPVFLLPPSQSLPRSNSSNPSATRRGSSLFPSSHRSQRVSTIQRVPRPDFSTAFYDFITSQLEAVVETALGGSDGGPTISFDISSSKDRASIRECSSSCTVPSNASHIRIRAGEAEMSGGRGENVVGGPAV